MTKILIVEDNPLNRDMLERRLRRCGYEICCAVDAPSGVAMAAEAMPDVILMDIALGETNGWDATRQIKATPATAHIPVIALTAHALSSDRAKSREVGCAEFETKPVDLDRLIGKINACVGAGVRPARTGEAPASVV